MEVSSRLPITETKSHKPQDMNIPESFSFTICDVDGGVSTGFEENTAEKPPENNKHRGSDAELVQQIQGEAQSRKEEFARLLEEHAQVIQELKQMEDEPVQA